MNPAAAVSHFVAVVLGVVGAVWLMGALAPDLPDPEEPPAVVEPETENGGDAASFFQPGPLSTAIFQLEEQQGDGTEYVFISIIPSSISTSGETAEDGIEPSFISVGEPTRVIEVLSRERRVITAAAVRQMDLVATADGPVWVVTLDATAPGISPPNLYVVPYGRSEIQAGGPLPTPLQPD